MMQAPAREHARLQFLDAARGVAILFFMLSHFAIVFFRAPEADAWRHLLVRLGMIATPTFVIISGVLLGALFHQNRGDFDRIGNRAIDRGLFLLLAGHLLVCIPLLRLHQGLLVSASTDAIGAAMIAGALLVPRMSARNRLIASAAAYAYSWAAVYLWTPHSWHGELVKEVVFGSLTPDAFRAGSFPFVPWTAVYLASTVAGERIARLHAAGAVRQSARELAGLGTTALGLVALLKVVALAAGVSALWGDVASPLLRVGQKYPPAPLYLLFYGGIGCLMLCGCLAAANSAWWRRPIACAARYGEASFFIFIAHFYVYWLVLYELGPGGPALGVVYFTASTLLLAWMATAWRKHNGNRLLTVGFGSLKRQSTLGLRQSRA